jgi:hypothetical protein
MKNLRSAAISFAAADLFGKQLVQMLDHDDDRPSVCMVRAAKHRHDGIDDFAAVCRGGQRCQQVTPLRFVRQLICKQRDQAKQEIRKRECPQGFFGKAGHDDPRGKPQIRGDFIFDERQQVRFTDPAGAKEQEVVLRTPVDGASQMTERIVQDGVASHRQLFSESGCRYRGSVQSQAGSAGRSGIILLPPRFHESTGEVETVARISTT